jgi:hypothetical protein
VFLAVRASLACLNRGNDRDLDDDDGAEHQAADVTDTRSGPQAPGAGLSAAHNCSLTLCGAHW